MIYWQAMCSCTGTQQDLTHTGKTFCTGKPIKNLHLPVHKDNRLYWQTMCFLYWHGTIFEWYWQDRIYWHDFFGMTIKIFFRQYIKKTDYTGKLCVLYTGFILASYVFCILYWQTMCFVYWQLCNKSNFPYMTIYRHTH